MSERVRTIAELIVAFFSGAAVLVLPVALDPNRHRYRAAVLPLIGDAVEGLRPYSLLLLIVLGIAMGVLFQSRMVLLAVSAVAIFPLWSTIDATIDFRAGGDRHNLLPLEWLAYGFYAALTLIGCVLGRSVRRRYTAPPNSA